MLEAGIDHLVLGCTHYPYLLPLLKELLPEAVRIIDCGEAVARQTYHVLQQNGLLNEGAQNSIQEFYTNGDVAILRRFVGDPDNAMKVAYLDF